MKRVKLPPAVLKFFQETGSVGGKIGGKSTSAAKRKSSAENGRKAAERKRLEKAKLAAK